MVLAILLSPGICPAFNVSGSYDSSEGAVTLQQSGDRVLGRYSQDNGELTGLLFGNIFEGFWIENSSDRRCSTPKNGRYHWGRATFEFTSSGFSGTWGYCNDVPNRGWSGSRTTGGYPSLPPQAANDADPFAVADGAAIAIAGVWNSSEGVINFHQQGNRVAGRYPNDNGEIVGVINNDTLSGYWIEDNSAKRCSTAKNGRYHWGRLELRFSGNTFSGKYGHCDGVLTSPWGGDRR